jgi:hypothetical protein
MNVRGGVVPFIQIAAGDVDLLPNIRPFEHARITILEHAHIQAGSDRIRDLPLRRPQILQVNRLALFILPQWFFIQIDIHGARQRIRHHQWRG